MVAVAMTTVGVLAACGDNPFELQWTESPDTTILYSLTRPELNLPSAFSFNSRLRIRVESPNSSGRWDVAIGQDESGLLFYPPGALGITSRAGVAKIGDVPFADVTNAPTDTARYARDRALPVELGVVYVVRTGEARGSFGQTCVYFAKMEPVVVDVESGTVHLLYDNNPVCNDTRLIPPN